MAGIKFVLTTALLIVGFQEIHGHGKLMDPVNRSSAWRKGFKTPPNYTDNENSCGGLGVSANLKIYSSANFNYMDLFMKCTYTIIFDYFIRSRIRTEANVGLAVTITSTLSQEGTRMAEFTELVPSLRREYLNLKH